ncbi:polysialyltransferase family glycosyltransferase [Marinilactibacillus sp. XAAS-LB27]|uniref:polysialyltransferase family glycosyltransferase n=1 Tax=Marinilactibacillus sp. XAAS-LB27 TaxID=3114538 RepID=UPI002E190807|nr:polysialyltransferase family glycosyltransferase [Marinilactibacillus sp. XAAS-LB27]
MNAFIAWTPLHLINIINTKVHYFDDELNDLYIYNEFKGAQQLYDRAVDIDIFDNVYLIKYNQMTKSYIKTANLLFNLNGYNLSKDAYENIFVQGDNYFAKLFYAYVKSNNQQVKLHYIEDGIGAYVESNIFDLKAKKNRLIKVINKNSIYRANFDKYFVYEPTLVQVDSRNKYLELPKLKVNTKAYNAIISLFEKTLNSLDRVKSVKYVFLDQPFQADGSEINEYKIFDIVQKAIKNQNELAVKLHPRSDKRKYGKSRVIDTDLPWELYCLANKAENTTIISMASSAAFTPSMMFDMKLPVIYLAEMIKNEFFSDQSDTAAVNTWLENAINVGNVLNIRMPDEINIPKTINDFHKFVD